MSQTRLVWASHPRHLPKPPAGRTVIVDVAFAAGSQWKTKTKPFLDAIGERLARYVDHHEHKEGWAHYKDDPRFLLVPNKLAHACPELVTPEVVALAGTVDDVVAHCDFDGAIAAAKWMRGGKEPWSGADEDARAIDSPGRKHTLSDHGARIAYAMDEASARFERKDEMRFMTTVTRALIDGNVDADPALTDEIDMLGRAAREAEQRARDEASRRGRRVADGLFLVTLDVKPDNRTRRNILVYAEEQEAIGAILEPDPQGGHWLIAATFNERLDLEDVPGMEGGRSDYRFGRAHEDGALIDALAKYAAQK